MNITEKHKELFRLTAELLGSNSDRLWICPTISIVSNRDQIPRKLGVECRQIVNDVFNPGDRAVIWLFSEDCNSDREFARNCRIIALYSLIYADL